MTRAYVGTLTVSACQVPPSVTHSSSSPRLLSWVPPFGCIALAGTRARYGRPHAQRWTVRSRRSNQRVQCAQGVQRVQSEQGIPPHHSTLRSLRTPRTPQRPSSTSTPLPPSPCSAFRASDLPSPSASSPTATPSGPSVPSRVFSASEGWVRLWQKRSRTT
jgi:hypothetical protein